MESVNRGDAGFDSIDWTVVDYQALESPRTPVLGSIDPDFGCKVRLAYELSCFVDLCRAQDYGEEAKNSRRNMTPSPVREAYKERMEELMRLDALPTPESSYSSISCEDKDHTPPTKLRSNNPDNEPKCPSHTSKIIPGPLSPARHSQAHPTAHKPSPSNTPLSLEPRELAPRLSSSPSDSHTQLQNAQIHWVDQVAPQSETSDMIRTFVQDVQRSCGSTSQSGPLVGQKRKVIDVNKDPDEDDHLQRKVQRRLQDLPPYKRRKRSFSEGQLLDKGNGLKDHSRGKRNGNAEGSITTDDMEGAQERPNDFMTGRTTLLEGKKGITHI